jgi:hypothetical protein
MLRDLALDGILKSVRVSGERIEGIQVFTSFMVRRVRISPECEWREIKY